MSLAYITHKRLFFVLLFLGACSDSAPSAGVDGGSGSSAAASTIGREEDDSSGAHSGTLSGSGTSSVGNDESSQGSSTSIQPTSTQSSGTTTDDSGNGTDAGATSVGNTSGEATTDDGPPPGDGLCAGGSPEGRIMECLDRGVIAVPSDNGTFISWRLFGTEAPDTTFNLYREIAGGAPALVCTRGPEAGTWCLDPDSAPGASYFVRSVVAGVEGPPSGASPLLEQDYLRIPLQPASNGAFVHLAWVGDLDGDGEYDVVVDRISGEAPLVDAYSRHGEFLWRLNTGPLGEDQNNIEGGPTVISNGHWDGLTVFDFDSNGSAEVAIKTANGFVFGDGTTLTHDNDGDQFVSIVSGSTGAELARAPLPTDYRNDGPLQCHFGAGYFDGVRPSVVVKCKNRVGSGGFNLVAAVYDFDGSSLVERWKYTRDPEGGADYHQIRILDVDGDGRDELADGGYVLDEDGTVLYSLASQGVVHGDRFHITDLDPARPGLEGFGIQQDNGNGLETYYYDAATGEVLREYRNPGGPGGDMGRGTVADLYADQPGFEYWSFNGMYASGSGDLVVAEQDRNVPWPNFMMQWDGDLGGELLDNNQVGDWNLEARSRNTYSWRRTFGGLVQARGSIPFYGDIYGDWREEALLEAEDHSELRIYTTTFETDVRLYTLVHNPEYRNCLTVHGYRQSNLVDYYLGFGMDPPPQPSIRLAQRP